jgi:hypothetical protein
MDLEPINQPINSTYNPAGMLSFIGHLGMIPGLAIVAAAGIVALGGATVDAVKKTIDWGLSLDDVMDKIGGTTEEAAGLKLVADAVGMSVDDATRSLNLMGKNLETTEGKIGSSGKALDELHISYRNANGTFRSSMDIFKDVSTVLNAMPDGLQKTRYEMEIFGRSGAQMNDMLRNAAAGGMQRFIDQAKAMGLALSADQVTGIEHMSENIGVMKDQFTGISVIIGSAFIPAIQAIVTWIGNLVTSVTPAIQHFGQFLGMLLAVPGASGGAVSAVAATSSAASGKPGGLTLAPWATAADKSYALKHPETYYVPGGGGGSAGIPAGTTTQEHGGTESFRMTGFEQAVKSFVDGIKAVNWAQVARDLNAAGKAVQDAIKFADKLIHPTLELAPGGESNDLFKGLKDQQVTIVDGLGKKISDFFAPKFDKQWTDNANQNLQIIKQGQKADEAIRAQTAMNSKINTTLVNLPGNIRAAMATRK